MGAEGRNDFRVNVDTEQQCRQLTGKCNRHDLVMKMALNSGFCNGHKHDNEE